MKPYRKSRFRFPLAGIKENLDKSYDNVREPFIDLFKSGVND